jgi:arylsulfatase A
MSFDIFPTIANLIDAEVSDDIDGLDIWNLLQGETKSPHEFLYLFDNEDITGIRTQRWTLVKDSYYLSFRIPLKLLHDQALLFDMEKDPGQRYSYSRDNPDVVNELGSLIKTGSDTFLSYRTTPVPELPRIPGK